MKSLFFRTGNTYSPLALRALLGCVIFPHGAQKVLGWFGGFGFEASMTYFTDSVGLPWIVGFLVIIIEFLGPLFLLLGFATRLWSLGILVVMAGIIATTFNEFFFMNWFGNQKTEGFEFFLLAIGMSLSLFISGAGKFSIDAWLNKSLHRKSSMALRSPVPERRKFQLHKTNFMQQVKIDQLSIRLLRNATLVIDIAGKKFLVDPMLGKKDAWEPIPWTNTIRNPTVDLPVSEEEIRTFIDEADFILLMHLHPDHWDEDAKRLVPKEKQIICQPEDAGQLNAQGFMNLQTDEQLSFPSEITT